VSAAAAAGARAEAVAAVEPEPVGSGSARDDCSAGPQAVVYCAPVAQDDSAGDETAQADCSAELAGYSVELRAADSSRDGYSVDSSRDDCLVAPRAADSLPGDCSVARAQADWAVLMVDDSAVRERPRPDVRSALADFPAGSPVG
jgi:hypothetical protein